MADVAVAVFGLSVVDVLVGDLGVLVGDDNVGVDICFCTGVLLRELVCKARGNGDLCGSFE